MKIFYTILSIIVISTVFISDGLHAEEELTEAESAAFTEMLSLDWKGDGTHNLPLSHSTLVVPEGYSAVIGEEAVKCNKIFGNTTEKAIESIVISDDFQNEIYFSYCNSGYISIDDWKSINPKDLLSEISKNTEKVNVERRKNGFGELHVVGWVQEPSLDKHSNTVFWAIEGITDNDENPIASHLVSFRKI